MGQDRNRVPTRGSRPRHGYLYALLHTTALCIVPQVAQAQAVNLGASANRITPDGRTATSLKVNGNVTDIRTRTISGGNAFNSFSRFEEAAGNTVNLHVPKSAGNLVNIVRDGPVVINGVLNSYKNGKIGGNVFFSDSFGFIVGQSGVVNVGSLTVNTPTKAFLENVIGSNGKVNQSYADRLIAGDIPISADGIVSIRGRINASSNIKIQGNDISIISADGHVHKLTQTEKFNATVNSKGQVSGGALVSRGGAIQLVASNDVSISGRVSSNAGKSYQAGSISVRAGRNIAIASSARLTANGSTKATGASNGGRIVVKADQALTAASGAFFAAHAGTSGNGGFVELSAHDETIGSIRLDLGATNGKSGALLLDPYNLSIGAVFNGDQNSDNYSSAPSIYSNGADVFLQADNSITIAAGGIIDTHKYSTTASPSFTLPSGMTDAQIAATASVGNSGSVTLQAQSITLQSGASIRAGAVGTTTNGVTTASTFAAGDVTLNGYDRLTQSTDSDGNPASSTTFISLNSVTIAGSITGHDVKILVGDPTNQMNSNADGGASLTIASTGSITTSSAGSIALTADNHHQRIQGLVSGTAIIDIAGTLNSGSISARADASGKANIFDNVAADLTIGAQTVVSFLTGLDAGYLGGHAEAKVTVEATAHLTATNNLQLSSKGTEDAVYQIVDINLLNPVGAAGVLVGQLSADVATKVVSGAHITAGSLDVSAYNDAQVGIATTVTSKAGVVAFNVAVTQATVNTNATIENGSNVTVTNALSLRADNRNDFSTSATVGFTGQGVAGFSIAYSDVTTNANAALSGTVNAGSVLVGATSTGINNATFAKVIAGSPTPASLTQVGGAIIGALLAGLPTTTNTAVPKVAGAVTVATSHQNASATIGDKNSAEPASHSPTLGTGGNITSTGNVAVFSRVVDGGVRSEAITQIVSNITNPTNGNPTASDAVSVGLAVGQFNHSSIASINRNAFVSGNDVGVSATTLTPITNTIADFSSVGAIFSKDIANIPKDIATSYANATAEAGGTAAIAGSVNYFAMNNDTEAWIASGAKVTQTGGPQTWSTQLTDSYTENWKAGVAVTAVTDTQTVNIAGNLPTFSLTGALGTGTASSVGGSLNYVTFSTTTQSGVAEGATVLADSNIDVNARTHDSVFNIAPSSGAAKGTLALNGITSVMFVTNSTHASVSNKATTSSDKLTIEATQAFSLLSVSGALSVGSGSAVGLSVAVIAPRTDTSAYIGDNHVDAGAFDSSVDHTFWAATSGSVAVTNLQVDATTSGAATVVAVAAAVSDPTPTLPGSGGSLADKILSGVTGAFDIALMSSMQYALMTASAASKAQSAAPEPGGNSLDAAGASAVTYSALATNASISGATISRLTTSPGDLTIKVQALNDTVLNSGAGSAAIDLSGSLKDSSAAVAGAIAIGLLHNPTTATIENSTITEVRDVSVLALGAGEQTVVGIGAAVSTGDNGTAASLSSSVAMVTDSVSARIVNSTITGRTTGARGAVDVNAYQTTNIGIGAGSLYLGGTSGFGVALTYASVDNGPNGYAANAQITASSVTQFASIDVIARDTSVIASGAAAGGGSPDGNGLAGAIVLNFISPKTQASIDGGGASNIVIQASGDINVQANGGHDSTLDSVISNATTAANGGTSVASDRRYDFSGDAVGATPTGAAIIAVAGLVQAGKNNVGLSLVYNEISQSHVATIATVQLTSGSNVHVIAEDGSQIIGVAFGVAVSTGTFAGLGSTAFNAISNDVTATIGGSGSTITNTIVTGQGVLVQALDSAEIRGGAGSLAISLGNAALGLGLADDKIGGTVSASIDGAKIISTSYDVVVDAESTGRILTVALGISISNGVGVAGSIALNAETTSVNASITGGADVTSNDNVVVRAYNSNLIKVIAGAAGVGQRVGIGLSVVTNSISGDTKAIIDGNSLVDAKALGSSIASSACTGSIMACIDNGALHNSFDITSLNTADLVAPDLTENKVFVHGLSVVATSHQDIVADAVTAGVTFSLVSVGVAVVPVINEVGGTTQASIDTAKINTRLGSSVSDVAVIASSHSFAGNFILSFGLGGFGGAGANATNTMDRTTQASIYNSEIGDHTRLPGASGVGTLLVSAVAAQDASDVVVGFAAGLGGAAASGIENIFNATTTAFIDRGTVTATTALVKADSEAGYLGVAGVAAVGLGSGVAGAFIVGISSNNTSAYIGDGSNLTTVSLATGLAVQATSENTFSTLAVGGAGAGGNATAGMVNMIGVSNVTTALLSNVNLSQTSTATNVGVLISASDTVTITPTTGAGALSATGAGLGAGANIVSLNSTVSSGITSALGTTITSPGTVTVSATGTKTVDSQTITVGAGNSTGIGAAVGVVTIGSVGSNGGSDELNGTASAVDRLGGGANLVLNAAGLADFRVAATVAVGHTASDQETRDYARNLYQFINANATSARQSALSVAQLNTYAPGALGANAAAFQTLVSKGVVSSANFVLNQANIADYRQAATDDQYRAQATNDLYRAQAATALGVATPSDAQLQAYISTNNLAQATDAQVHIYEVSHGILVSATTDAQVLQYANTLYRSNVSQITAYYATQQRLALNALAPAALGADASTYQTLLTRGTLSSTGFTLNSANVSDYQAAATLSLYRSAATVALYHSAAVTSLGITSPTDDQVNSYVVLHGLASATDAQVQSYITAHSSAAATTTQVLQYATDLYAADVNKITAYASNALRSERTSFVLSNAGVAAYKALPGNSGLTTDGAQVAANTSYAYLTAHGSTAAGIYSLNLVQDVASATGSYARSKLSSSDFTKLSNLIAAGTVDAAGNYTLNTTSRAAYRSDAAADAGVTTPTDAQIDAYATKLYQGFARQVQPFADSDYQFLVSQVDRSSVSLSTALSLPVDGIRANITGGTVNANTVLVQATGATSVANMATGVGVGAIGVGAAVTVTTVDQTIQARAGSGTINANTVSIRAIAQNGAAGGIGAEAKAGAGGLAAAIGAAAAVAIANNNVSASLGGTVHGGAGNQFVSVNAQDISTLGSKSLGAVAAGGAAIGLSLAYSNKHSTIDAEIAPAALITNFAAIGASASSAGAVTSDATAGAGGLGLAIAGSVATSFDAETVIADIGAGATLSAGGNGILVSATATPNLSSNSFGVAVSEEIGIGASVAVSLATVNVKAYADDDAVINSIGGLTITASQLVPSSGDSAYAKAVAGAGGAFFGAQATSAVANNASTVQAYGGKRLTLPDTPVSISAVNDTKQEAYSTGIAAGFIGVGASFALASSSATTSAWLDVGVLTLASHQGDLSISAVGDDNNISRAYAGSGGVFAGAAAIANTSATSTTTAELRGDGATRTLYLGGLTVDSEYKATFYALGDAFQASAVGASGGITRNDVNATVNANIGNNLIVNSTGDIAVTAKNTVIESNGSGARAGSGGILSGAATFSDSHVTNVSTANVGANTILSLNDDPTTTTGKIDIEASNSLTTADTVSLTAAGLFAGGGGISRMTADVTNTVNIGTGAFLFSAGNIYVGTSSVMTASNNANADLYGFVTGAGASTTTTLTANQTVNVNANARIEAWGLVNITAGISGDGTQASRITANATTEVYNYAVFPISAEYAGNANTYDYTGVTLAAGSKVLSAANVLIGASHGTLAANGRGTNHNPYLALLSITNHRDNHDSNSSASLVLNGTVAAGIHNQETVTINYDNTVSPFVILSPAMPTPYALAVEYVPAGQSFSSTVSYNHQVVQYSTGSGFNPYVDIINKLVALSGLSFSEAQQYADNGSLPHSLSVTSDVQRQIDTLRVQAQLATNAPGNTVTIGNILVSSGDVTIQADTISGNGNVTAKGSAQIDIEHNGVQFLVLNKLSVSTNDGGHINFTGAVSSATATAAGITQTFDLTNSAPKILVNSNYAGQHDAIGNLLIEDASHNPLTTRPDIYFAGDVSNLNGLVSVHNQLGSVAISSQHFDAGTIEMIIPNGNLTVNQGGGSVYSSDGTPSAQWNNERYRPTSADAAVMLAVNSLEANQLNYIPQTGQHDGGNTVVNGTGTFSPTTDSGTFTARTLVEFFNGGGLISDIYLPTGEGAGNRQWHDGDFGGSAYSGNSPFNYATNGNFFTRIDITPLVYTSNGASAPGTAAPKIVGGAIVLSASYLNINGTLQSGTNNTYAINIGDAALAQINAIRNDPGLRAQNAGKFIPLTIASSGGPVDHPVGAVYDVSKDEIDLQNIVQGSPGKIYLNGAIISTSTNTDISGNLIVNGGYASANIVNTTGVNLVTGTINTGASSSSVVEIVDQNFGGRKTWYVYNASSGSSPVNVYQRAGGNANDDYHLATLTTPNGGGTTQQYAPKANLLYQWVETGTLVRSNTATRFDDGWHFLNQNPNTSAYPYDTVSTSVVTGTQSTVFREVVDAYGATYHTINLNTAESHDKCCGTNFNGNWEQRIFDHITLRLTNTVRASNPINVIFQGSANGDVNVTSNASVVVNGSIRNVNGSTSITTSGANSAIVEGAAGQVTGNSVTLTAPGGIGTSIKPLQVQAGLLTASSVDHDINLNVAGSVRVHTIKANATGGTPQGSVSLTASGDITIDLASDVTSPIVTGKSITLNSTGGAIGATTVAGGIDFIGPVVIQATGTLLPNGQVDGGVLNSSSSTGTYIAQSRGDLRLGRVTSLGPVFIEAAGSDGQTANILNGIIANAPTQADITRLNAVWTSLDLQAVNTHDGTFAQNGIENVAFQGSVAVHSFESMVNRAYQDYWQLLNFGVNDSSSFTLSATGSKVIAAQLAAARGVTADQISTPDIKAEATNRFLKTEFILGLKTEAQLPVSLATLFGTQAGTDATAFQSASATSALGAALQPGGYNSSFSYVLPTNSTVYQSLTSGSKWSLDQLTYAIDRSADPASGVGAPTIAALPQNISGRQVMLYAPTGSIGSLAIPRDITFSVNDASALTPEVKTALSAAGPGELSISVSQVNGVDQYHLTLQQQKLVIVSPLGPVAAKAKSDIYLGSAHDIQLGGIPQSIFPVNNTPGSVTQGIQTTNGGNVRIVAVDNILGVAGQVAVSGNIGSLTLIAENGDIGAAPVAGADPYLNPNALLIAFQNGAASKLDQANALQGSIYIRQTNGDLVLGNISGGSGAGTAVQLAATGSIYAESQFTDPTAPHILGNALDLRAGVNIGFNGSTAQPVQVAISGPVTGYAPGNISLFSPTRDLIAGTTSSTFSTLTSGGRLVLDATGGNLAINANVSGVTGLELLANGGVTLAAGSAPVVGSSGGAIDVIAATLAMGAQSRLSASGSITIVTTGDAVLGQLISTLSPAIGATDPAIKVTAGGLATRGSILGNGDPQETIVASGVNGNIGLTASGDIGATTRYLTVNATLLSFLSSAGNAFLHSDEALHVTSGAATLGSVSLTDALSLQLDLLNAGKAIAVRSTGGAVTVGSATSGGSQTIEARNTLAYTTLKTTGILADVGDINLTSDLASITGVSTTTPTVVDSLDANGSFTLNAATTVSGTTFFARNGSGSVTGAGAETLGAVTTSTTFGAASTGSTLTIGSATSGGTQILHAKNALAYTTLKTTGSQGDINLTSDLASIAGILTTSPAVIDSLDAGGAFTLNAATTVSGTTFFGRNGSGSMTGAGAVTLGAVTTSTTFGAASTGSTLTIGSATSGGTQILHAKNALAYTTLKTTGSQGDINLTSDLASITGASTTTPAVIDSLDAGGAFTLNAATTVSGTTFFGRNGSGSITTPGAITVSAVETSGSFGATSSDDAVTIGSATSGATQTILARNALSYTTLKTTGAQSDISLTSQFASITGASTTTPAVIDSLDADGSFTLSAGTTITATKLKARHGAGSLTATGTIDVGTSDTATSFVATTAGAVTLDTVTAGTTLGAASTGSTLTVGSATSGGTQTLHANNALAYTTLKTTGSQGDINLTSDLASIAGVSTTSPSVVDSLDANGSFTLNAATTVSGTTFFARNGSGSVTGAGAETLGAVATSTTFGATSTGSTLTIGSATSGGSQTLHAKNALAYTTLKTTGSQGDINLTSDLASITGVSTTSPAVIDSLDANGSFTLNAATTVTGTSFFGRTGSGSVTGAGALTLASIETAASFGARSTGDAITIGSATSGGTQTIRAKNALAYTTLKTTGSQSDINLTSDLASITGVSTLTPAVIDSLDADGSFSLNAGTTITATRLTARHGAGSLTATGMIHVGTSDTATSFVATTAGAVTLDTVTAGTTLGATSTGSALTVGTATSGGTQTLHAHGALGVTTLVSTGGSINATSDTGAIVADTVTADQAARLIAAGPVTGNRLTTVHGGAGLESDGAIAWQVVSAGTTFDATSSAGPITLGTAISGGTQTIAALQDVNFTQLTATNGDVKVLSVAGRVIGGSIDANNVDILGQLVTFDKLTARADATVASVTDIHGHDVEVVGTFSATAGLPPSLSGSLAFDILNAAAANLEALDGITLSQISGRTKIGLSGRTITAHITVVNPPGVPQPPFVLNVNGVHGGIAETADFTIDGADVVNIGKLYVVDGKVVTSGGTLTIADGNVPGALALTTPYQTININNRSPAPTNGANLQLYAPNHLFSFGITGQSMKTDAYVVRYDVQSQPVDVLSGAPFDGLSVVRQSDATFHNGAAPVGSVPWIMQTFVTNTRAWSRLFDAIILPDIGRQNSQPAVNLGGDTPPVSEAGTPGPQQVAANDDDRAVFATASEQ